MPGGWDIAFWPRMTVPSASWAPSVEGSSVQMAGITCTHVQQLPPAARAALQLQASLAPLGAPAAAAGRAAGAPRWPAASHCCSTASQALALRPGLSSLTQRAGGTSLPSGMRATRLNRKMAASREPTNRRVPAKKKLPAHAAAPHPLPDCAAVAGLSRPEGATGSAAGGSEEACLQPNAASSAVHTQAGSASTPPPLPASLECLARQPHAAVAQVRVANCTPQRQHARVGEFPESPGVGTHPRCRGRSQSA